MRIIILSRPNRDYTRAVDDWIKEFEMIGGTSRVEPELLDPDSRAGEVLARAYNVMNYPAVLVTAEDGKVIRGYSGMPLPMISEIKGYTFL